MEDSSPKMDIFSHIKELRNRLLVSVIALVITTIVSFAFSQTLAELLAKPIGGLSAMSSIDVTENVSAFMKISLLSGVLLALPVILFEVLAFIMPGLHPRERSWIWMMVPTATLFFAAGVAFAYFFMLPAALTFLLNFMGITTSPRPNNYFTFVTNLMFWVGVSFEMPLVMYILARLHIVSAKGLLKQWRVAIIGTAVLAAVITPTPDPVNMGLMMIPLFALYLLSIIFAAAARREHKEKKKRTRREKILRGILLVVVVAAAATVSLLWPREISLVLRAVTVFVQDLWTKISAWFSKI
ncbi:MAG: twin-arginine translocase subunit TatC [Chloroflexi bacterium]|nr:twin-arginine translocase subunit TatC [Chloroflexota bacterium]